MKIRKTKTATRTFTAMLGIGFGLCISTNVAHADDRIDLGELTAQWWQWASSIPVGQNPIVDKSGGSCMVGQRGLVWFLAGNFGGTTIRKCPAVPAGTTLFFPIINQIGYNSPNACGQDSRNLSVKDLRAGVADFIRTVTDLRVDLDSIPIHNFQRVQSDVFHIALPADNIFNLFSPCAAGVYSPSVDDGYYVKLDPLRVGPHTLRIRGAAPGFSLDVTYDLTVVKVVDK